MKCELGFIAFRKDKYTISGTEHMKKIQTGKGLTILYSPSLNNIIAGDLHNFTLYLGDAILEPESFTPKNFNGTRSRAKGNYYQIDATEECVTFISGFPGNYPVYYSIEQEIITSSLTEIKKLENFQIKIDKQFIVESLLLNHSFTDRTILENFKQLSSGSKIILSENKMLIKPGKPFFDYFVSSPLSHKKSRKELIECFSDVCSDYYTDDKPAVSLTSGFDGRTVLSSLIGKRKEVFTYSYGKKENIDVQLPSLYTNRYISRYLQVDLGTDEYIKEGYPEFSKEYILNTSGGNGLLYPHVLFTAEELLPFTKIALTGYFGSELLRTVHLPGAITSRLLLSAFSGASPEQLGVEIFSNPAIRYIKNFEPSQALSLAEELSLYVNKLPAGLTRNQKLYNYILGESSRKIFGSWIYSQATRIKVRSPFMDEKFISQLLRTSYAAVYNDFRTTNPFVRRKGQLLYADILKENSLDLYNLNTGKGYSPRQLHGITGNLGIALNWTQKKLHKGRVNYDNLGIISGCQYSSSWLLNNINEDYFNPEEIIHSFSGLNPSMRERDRDDLLMVLSLNHLINNLING